MMTVERIRLLSDRVLQALADETTPNVAIVALVDAAVRILRLYSSLDVPAACKEIARVAVEIGRAEAGQ